MKKNILLMIVTAIIFTGIGVYATIQYQANEIGYGTGTVKDAIDDLYTTANTTVTGLENQITDLQNQVDNPDCIKGNHTITLNDIQNDYVLFNYVPSDFTIYVAATNGWIGEMYWTNKKPNIKKWINNIHNTSSLEIVDNTNVVINSSNVVFTNIGTDSSSSWLGAEISYTVCK